MDSPDPDWASTALFSPSKARLAQAQAKDWVYVDAWLARKYSGSRIPEFERNDETLQALLTLAAANEGADEERAAVGRVEREALRGLRGRDGAGGGGGGLRGDVYEVLMRELSERGGESVDVLAELGVLLHVSGDAGVVDLAVAVTDLQTEEFELQQQLRRVEDQRKALQREAIRLKALLRDLKDDAFHPPPDLVEQTADWTKNAKHLKAKISEYDERLSSLRSADSYSPSLEGVARQSEQLRVLQQKLLGLETEMRAFQSLPSNVREAKVVVEEAREELRGLMGRREGLFEEMMGRG